MKKLLSLLLVFALLLTLCACGTKKTSHRDDDDDDRGESSGFASSMADFADTLAGQEPESEPEITPEPETVPEAEPETAPEPETAISSVYDWKNYPVYPDIYMGMSLTEAETALGQTFTMESGTGTGSYAYDFNCPSYTSIPIEGTFYMLTLGFDAQEHLIHVCLQGSYDEETFQSIIRKNDEDFGAMEYVQSIVGSGVLEDHIWYAEPYTIEASFYTLDGMPSPAYCTLTYYYTI